MTDIERHNGGSSPARGASDPPDIHANRPGILHGFRVEYDRAPVQRGDITLRISTDAADAWKPTPCGRRGGQRKFSDHAIAQ